MIRSREKIICFVWDVAVAQHSPISARSLGGRVNVSLTCSMFWPPKMKFDAEGSDLGAFGFKTPALARRSDAVMEPFSALKRAQTTHLARRARPHLWHEQRAGRIADRAEGMRPRRG